MPDLRPAMRFAVLERLEDRTTPAVVVRFDYGQDSTGFFNDPARKAALERAAALITPYLQDTLAPIAPAGANTWAETFANPITGQTVRVDNPTVNANEVVIYVGGAKLGGAELGLTTSGGYTATGTQAWLNVVRSRGQAGALTSPKTDYATWGGMITFDSSARWNFDPALPKSTDFDFQSVATHELMHVFGFGLGEPAFTRHISGGRFVGPHVTALVPGGVPVVGDPGESPDHFVANTTYQGQDSPMQPSILPGVRRVPTPLEYAALTDVGWQVAAAPGYAGTQAPTAQVAVANSTQAAVRASAPVGRIIGRVTVGTAGGTATVGAGGAVASTAQPFGPGYAGGVRVATADVTGDGVPDTVAGTGPGGPAEVRVLDGATGAVVAVVQPFEATFTGGVFVAAADLTGDGKADLVITPDGAGGPVVAVYDGAGLAAGQPKQLARFFGLNDSTFRGGLRPTLGDVNGDRVPDLVLSAGYGGGPRVSVWDGRTVPSGVPTNVVPDFFAFDPSLRNGAFVAVADIDGDGVGDIIAGAGPGGGPRVTVFSGKLLTAGSLTPVANFFAGDPTSRGGVRVAAADLNGSGRPDVVIGTAGQALAFAPASISLANGAGTPVPELSIDLPGSPAADGVFVG